VLERSTSTWRRRGATVLEHLVLRRSERAHDGASGCAAAARLPLPVRTQQGAWDCRCLRRTGARVPGCRKEARGHGHASLGSAAMAAPAAAAKSRSRRHGKQNGQGRGWRGRGWCGAAHRVLDLGGGKPEGGDRRWGRSFGEAPMVGGQGSRFRQRKRSAGLEEGP